MKSNEQRVPYPRNRLERAQQKLAAYEGLSIEDARERLEDLRERSDEIARDQPEAHAEFIRWMRRAILFGFVKAFFLRLWDYIVEIVQNVPD